MCAVKYGPIEYARPKHHTTTVVVLAGIPWIPHQVVWNVTAGDVGNVCFYL